jgi:hypothetical protein
MKSNRRRFLFSATGLGIGGLAPWAAPVFGQDKDDKKDKPLVRAVEAFIRMYRPHEAREDTVLFPAFRKIVTAKELKELGEKFEKEEDRLFGDEGFEKTVDQVATIEKQLGIYDLAQFTPKLSGK